MQTDEKGEKKMTMVELQKVMGDRVSMTLQENITPEERQENNEQTALIIGLAKQMINNGDFVLRTEKLMAQTKALKHSYAMDFITGENGMA